MKWKLYAHEGVSAPLRRRKECCDRKEMMVRRRIHDRPGTAVGGRRRSVELKVAQFVAPTGDLIARPGAPRQ